MTGNSDRNFTKITLWQGFHTRQIFRRGSWPACWKGIDYIKNPTQVPGNVFLYSLFLPWKSAVDIVFQYFPVSHPNLRFLRI